MTDVTTIVDGYIAMWNETSGDARREIIAATWADDATYLDPLMSGAGAAGLDAMVSGAQEQFPGCRFELTAGPDHHHDRVRFSWRMLGPNGGDAVAHGVDFGTLADDGRLHSVTGFLEPAASK